MIESIRKEDSSYDPDNIRPHPGHLPRPSRRGYGSAKSRRSHSHSQEERQQSASTGDEDVTANALSRHTTKELKALIHAHTYDDLKPKGGCAYNKLNNYEKTTARLQPQSYSQSRAAVATGFS